MYKAAKVAKPAMVKKTVSKVTVPVAKKAKVQVVNKTVNKTPVRLKLRKFTPARLKTRLPKTVPVGMKTRKV